MAERIRASDSSSGVSGQLSVVSSPGRDTCVFKSKTLNHDCFVLQMGRKAVGPVCCVTHVKEPSAHRKEKGFAPVFLV